MKKTIKLVAIGLAIGGMLGCYKTSIGPVHAYNADISTPAAIKVVTNGAITGDAVSYEKKKKIKVKYTRDKVYVIRNVNLRKKPNLKYKNIIKILKIGTKVKRIGIRKDGWAIVRYKGKTRYIMNKYLSKKKPKIVTKHDSKLRGKRKYHADLIATYCIKNYKKYKVLPSICIAQAITESGLGESCPTNNLWGISTNHYQGYPSLEAGTLKYLSVINNGYYDGAVGEKNYRKAAYAIANGGYCYPANGYAAKVISAVEMYDLTDYDKYVQ